MLPCLILRYYFVLFNIHISGHIQTALEDRNMMDNTYFIFASDNGGCYLGGGKNAPLRGNKATLLEGATCTMKYLFFFSTLTKPHLSITQPSIMNCRWYESGCFYLQSSHARILCRNGVWQIVSCNRLVSYTPGTLRYYHHPFHPFLCHSVPPFRFLCLFS